MNTAGNVDPPSIGLEHQKATGKGNVAREPRSLVACGLFHDLHQSFLAWLKEVRNGSGSLPQSQRAQIGDVNEAVSFTFADFYKGGINSWVDIFHHPKIDVTDLMLALGNNQLVNTFVVENGSNAQLFSNKNLLGHGRKSESFTGDGGGEESYLPVIEASRQTGAWNEPPVAAVGRSRKKHAEVKGQPGPGMG